MFFINFMGTPYVPTPSTDASQKVVFWGKKHTGRRRGSPVWMHIAPRLWRKRLCFYKTHLVKIESSAELVRDRFCILLPIINVFHMKSWVDYAFKQLSSLKAKMHCSIIASAGTDGPKFKPELAVFTSPVENSSRLSNVLACKKKI